MIWKNRSTLEAINKETENTLSGHLGIEYIEIGPDYLTASMPVDERTLQPAGILHGGATMALAESVGSVAGRMAVDPGKTCVGLDINANHVSSAKPGSKVYGTASPIHIGRSTQVWEIEVTTEDQKLISLCRLTLANLG